MFLAVVATSIMQLFSVTQDTHAAVGSTASDIWYVRTAAECAVNGDGLAYDCATTPGGHGAFNGTTPTQMNWTPATGIDDGDIVYICGTHHTGLYIGVAAAGSQGKPITIHFGCPGNAGKIIQQTVLAEALQATNWVNEASGRWYLSLASYANSPKRVWANMVELMRSETKDVLGQPVSLNGPVRGWWFDDVNNRLYLPSTVNPAVTLMELRTLSSSNTPCSFSAICLTRKENKFFDIVNPNIEGGGLGAIYILGATDIRIFGSSTVDDCRIGRLSNRGIYISDSSGNGSGVASARIEVFNCRLDPGLQESIDGYTHELNGVTHDGIFISEGSNDNNFHDLIVNDWQHTGISIAAIRGTTTITNNRISNVTFTCQWFVEYCRAFGVDGSRLHAATGNMFVNNRVKNMTVRSQLNGNGNIVEGNLFTDQRIGAVVIDKSHISQVLEFQGYAGPSQDNLIRRNIFANNLASPCISFRNGTNTVSGNIIVENTFINCGGLDTPGAEYTALYIPEDATIGAQVIRNNTFLVSNGEAPIHYKNLGKISAIAFNAGCSGDVCEGNVAIDAAQYPVMNSDEAFATRCGIGMWWQMTPVSIREFLCFHH